MEVESLNVKIIMNVRNQPRLPTYKGTFSLEYLTGCKKNRISEVTSF